MLTDTTATAPTREPHIVIETPAGDIDGTRPALARGDLVLTPDGFRARVRWTFYEYGEMNAHVQRLGGYPTTLPVRLLARVND
jgi:hypothetical protein